MSKKNLAILLLLLGISSGYARPADHESELTHRRQIEEWRAERLARLTGEEGWLTLAGLFWLDEGDNRFGSGPSNKIFLPKGKAPAVAGTLVLAKGEVRLLPAAGAGVTIAGEPAAPMTLKSDAGAQAPTVVKLGKVSFFIIKRGEKLGVRVRDTGNPVRKNFKGLDYFPVDARWRVEARFEPYAPPKTVEAPTVLGTVEKDVSPGALAFTVKGKTYRLDPVFEEGSEELFIIFADDTNGKETYGAGRFVYAPMPKDGRAVIDFNKAYNPPCAFTPYATCPLPPPQNRLPVRVEAGEKSYAVGHHGASFGEPSRAHRSTDERTLPN